MCGIAGYINLDGRPASPVILKAMTDAIAHRGPNGEGQVVRDRVALGHRRLSIIDLSAQAHQPMITHDGAVVLIFNGEIYNFRELRLDLEARGHCFRSQSDTEVLLEALAEWGDDCIPRFNGMFAFAALYEREHRILLARDRYGVKPLYYTQVGRALLFASEIKAFLAHPDFTATLDPDGLAEYMTFQNYLDDATLFRGVRMLPPGTTLSISLNGKLTGPKRYWDFHFCEDPAPPSHGELLDTLDDLFVQAVSRQLVSDVPVSAYLSGGMDTASITAIASRQLPHMRSFTIGFDMSSVSGLELAYDERAKAERISALCGTEHYEMVLKAGDMERAIDKLVWHLESPRVGQSYPNFYAAKLAGKFDRVVLSGAGGDELFAGYPWRYYRSAGSTSFDDYAARYFEFWQRLVPNDSFNKLLAPLKGAYTKDAFTTFRSVFDNHANVLKRPEDYINHSLYFEAKTFLHGLLVVDDKLSMAHSLETRVPFLDNDLVDFAMGVPVRFKLGNLGSVVRINENEPGPKAAMYSSRTQDGKLLLREAMARYIPADVTSAVKQGFSGPDAIWFRGQSIEYVRRVLLDPRARLYDYLDFKTVRALVTDHLEGRENRRLLIWSLICLASWCDQFLAGGHQHAALAPKRY